MAIVQAIRAGQRTPRKVAELADPRVKASQTTIARSLPGNWRPELWFVLRQEMEIYPGSRVRSPLATSSCSGICKTGNRK
jgi:hypothetical protein